MVGGLGKRRALGRRLDGPRDSSGCVGEEAEDGGEVGVRRARQPKPVLLGAGMGAFVRPDAALPILLHANAREEPAPAAPRAVRSGVVLLEDPERGLGLLGQDAACAPVGEGLAGVLVRVFAVGTVWQVDLDDVAGVLREQLGT